MRIRRAMMVLLVVVLAVMIWLALGRGLPGATRSLAAEPPNPAAQPPALAAICTGTNNTNYTIPDNNPASPAVSRITLNCPPAQGKTVTDMYVTVHIVHTHVGDLVVSVREVATGRSSIIWNRACGGTANINQTFHVTYFNGHAVNQAWELVVSDNSSIDTGYIDGWDIKIYYCPPTIESVNPSSGESCASATQLFTTTIADCVPNVSLVEYHFDAGGLNKVNSVYLRYDRRHNQLYLRDAANTLWLGGYAPGDDQVIENGFGRLHVRETSAQNVGSQLQVTWAIEFLPAYAGRTYNQLLYAANLDGQADGWRNMGTWAVQSCAAETPTPTPATPPTATATETATATATATVTTVATVTATVATATATTTDVASPTPTATATATQPLPAQQQRIPLHSGWNWFSFYILPAAPGGDCSGVRRTPYFAQYFGNVTLDGQPAPAGTRIELFDPRGDRVGCMVATGDGFYPYTRAYGEDADAGIPGLHTGEAVAFKVNGFPAQTTPAAVVWQSDSLNHQVDLAATTQVGVAAALASIADKYNLVLSETGVYAPPPADPRFNTLTGLLPGQTYLIRMTEAGELVLDGAPVAADTPIPLAPGWRWIGCLPDGAMPVGAALASIAGKYNLLLSETGVYAPPPADPRFNTLTQIEPGEGYMIHMTQAGTLIYLSPGTAPLLRALADPSSSCSGVQITPYFSQYYGLLTINGADAPAGTLVELFSPRAEKVGCAVSGGAGFYPYLRAYGADSGSAIPGMAAGEAVTFKVNGVVATSDPATVSWQNDMAIHQVNLSVMYTLRSSYLPLLLKPGR